MEGGSARKGVRFLKEWEFKGSVQGGGRSKGRGCPKQGHCQRKWCPRTETS